MTLPACSASHRSCCIKVAGCGTRGVAVEGQPFAPVSIRSCRSKLTRVADGAYDQTGVTETVAEHTPDAAVIVPPRSMAVPSANAETKPTPRDQLLQDSAKHGRMVWQKSSQYNVRALVEACFRRWKRVIGDSLRFRTEDRRNTEIAIAVWILNHRLDLGRPDSVRVA
jgi:hypothetical protein